MAHRMVRITYIIEWQEKHPQSEWQRQSMNGGNTPEAYKATLKRIKDMRDKYGYQLRHIEVWRTEEVTKTSRELILHEEEAK